MFRVWGDLWPNLERGESLPLTAVPVQYRNDEESRRLIAEGVLESPWR
jgi:hypothetical protein